MKKHKLLREDILPAMASNRKVQRLLNEFMDLLSEYEIIEPNVEVRNLATSTSHPSAADKMNSDMPMAEQINSEPSLAAAQPCSDLQATKQNDTASQNVNHIESTSQVRDQMDLDLEKTDQSESIQPTTDEMNLELPASESLNPGSTSPAKETES